MRGGRSPKPQTAHPYVVALYVEQASSLKIVLIQKRPRLYASAAARQGYAVVERKLVETRQVDHGVVRNINRGEGGVECVHQLVPGTYVNSVLGRSWALAACYILQLAGRIPGYCLRRRVRN